MRETRTRRERIWRACLIQRRWRTTDIAAATGIDRSTVGVVLRELSRAGVVVHDGRGEWRAVSHDARLSIHDPERQSARRRAYDLIAASAPAEVRACDVARACDLGAQQAREALSSLAEQGLIERVGHGRYVLSRAGEVLHVD